MERIDIDMSHQVFAGWKIGKEIGHGAFATVYELRKGNMLRALKVIPLLTKLEGTEQEIEEQLESKMEADSSEIEANHRVSGHTNIVNYQEYEFVIVWNKEHTKKEGLLLYIMMEYMEKTLYDEIKKGTQFSEEQVIKLGKDITTALKVCHEETIVHRDIKPANIFIADRETYKLGDFGIAKILGDNTVTFTHAGAPAYVAPDQWNGSPYGQLADIYSIGLVLYQLLNENHLPFSENGVTADSVERRLKGESFPEPRHGSKRLKAIVMKACSYKTSERYQTVEEMLHDLENIQSVIVADDQNKPDGKDLYSTVPANKKKKTNGSSIHGERNHSGNRETNTPLFRKDLFQSEGLASLKEERQNIAFTGFRNRQETAVSNRTVNLTGFGLMIISILMVCFFSVALTVLQSQTGCFYTAGAFLLGLIRQLADQINSLR